MFATPDLVDRRMIRHVLKSCRSNPTAEYASKLHVSSDCWTDGRPTPGYCADPDAHPAQDGHNCSPLSLSI
jgi:hypothetical protein